MKKILIVIPTILILCFVILSILPNKNAYMDKLNKTQTGSATWAYGAHSIDELMNYSDLIVKGKVIDYEPIQDGDLIFTFESVEVLEVIKGNVSKGDKITVVITGGELNGKVTNPIEDCPIMDMRTPYMLFLQKTDSGHYAIVAGNQGFGRIKNNTIEYTAHDNLTSLLKEYNEKTLTQKLQNEIKMVD